MKTEKIGKGNIARVFYEKQENGTFLIVGLENFLSIEGIERKYGKRVRERYFSQLNSMWRIIPLEAEKGIHVTFITPRTRDLITETFYTKEEFTESIAEAKLCGSTLSRIIKEVKNATKVIEI